MEVLQITHTPSNTHIMAEVFTIFDNSETFSQSNMAD